MSVVRTTSAAGLHPERVEHGTGPPNTWPFEKRTGERASTTIMRGPMLGRVAGTSNTRRAALRACLFEVLRQAARPIGVVESRPPCEPRDLPTRGCSGYDKAGPGARQRCSCRGNVAVVEHHELLSASDGFTTSGSDTCSTADASGSPSECGTPDGFPATSFVVTRTHDTERLRVARGKTSPYGAWISRLESSGICHRSPSNPARRVWSSSGNAVVRGRSERRADPRRRAPRRLRPQGADRLEAGPRDTLWAEADRAGRARRFAAWHRAVDRRGRPTRRHVDRFCEHGAAPRRPKRVAIARLRSVLLVECCSFSGQARPGNG